jgi:hypothetical protein
MNDQRRGRLNLIRHLLDALPDFDVKPEPIALPPLAHEPLREVVEAKVDWVPTRY